MELFLYDVIPERATGEDNKKAQEDEKKQQQPSYGVNNTALELEAAVASKITIHDLLKGVKDMDGNPYLQAQDYPDMPLVALHNTDARKVRHMHELGGIALPSIAVTRADLPYTNFGDITLIGDAAFIDPEQKENAAYDADVYSPRYPEIYGYKVEKGAAERFAQMLETHLTKFSGETLSRTDRALLQTALENGVDGTVKGTGLTRERTVRDAWLGARGKTQADFASEGDRDWYIREHMEAFREWVETQFTGVNKQAIMFAGYTRSGNRRTKDYTLDNIVKHMRGEIRNGEGELYSVGNLRAAHAKQYKNVAGMQQDRGRIVRQEDMQAWKDKLNAKWEELTKGLAVGQLAAVEDIILNRPKRKWQALLDEAGISEISAKDLRAFVKEITDAPTEYFEVKKQGAVGLNEFIGAVIPDDTPADVREILTDAGLEIFEYDRADGAGDAVFAATKELHQEHGNILFQAENDIGRWDITGAAGNAVWNAIATGTNGARKIPLADMVANSLQAGWDAAPAVLGMSMLMGAGANVRFVNKAAHMMLPEFQMQKEAITNAVGQRMVADLLADKDTNALFKKDPALYAETVQQAANDAGVGSFWADAQTLMASEEGRGALNSLVREGVITQEALETAVQTEGRIEVPVGTYLQADLTEDERAAAQTATTWTEGGMLPAELDERRKALAVSKYAAALEEEMQRTADAIEHVVNDQFSTYSDADKDVVREVMAVNPRNLREGYTSVRQSLIEAIEGITGDVESMRQNHGEGVDYITFDGDGEEVTIDSKDIHYSRRSSVNELWYSKFYETYGRAPRWIEYYDIALDEMKGDIEQLYGTPEYDEGIAEYNRGKELYERLEALEGLRDDLYAVQDTGMLTLKASLTDDGLAVYRKVQDVLTSVGGEAAQSAEQAAFLWAKRAETFARIMQDMGRGDFTARDYLEMHPIFAEDTFGAGKKAPEQYWQLNDDVDLNETLEIIDLPKLGGEGAETETEAEAEATATAKRHWTVDVAEWLNALTDGAIDLEDGTHIQLVEDGARHIVFSPAKTFGRRRIAKKYVPRALEEILRKSKRIETGDNSKPETKPDALKYHRYYAAIRAKGAIYPLRLVVEERAGKFEVKGAELFLYDVIPERAKGQDDETAQGNKKKQQQSDGGGPNTVLSSKTAAVTKIRIADLLKGVKDMDGNPYLQAQDYPDMPLVALHNTDARKFRPHCTSRCLY